MLKAVVFDEFSIQCPYFYSYELEHDLSDNNIDWNGLCEDGEVSESDYLLVETGESATNEQKEAMKNYELYMHRYDKKWLDEHGIENSLYG